MKVGDYVRTPYGIRKIKDIRIKDNYLDDGFYIEDRFIVCGHKAMQEVKSSPNIIDLIEVGDIIRGKDNHLFEVYAVGSDCVYINNLEEFILIKDIKGIVTKEQFSQMEYRIEE